MPRTTIIYAWVCPLNHAVVYVGKTAVSLKDRMYSHRREALGHYLTKKHQWLKDIINQGLFPDVVDLYHCSVEESAFWERHYIAYYKSLGCELLNIAVGGGGNPGCGRIIWTPELDAKLGKYHDIELARELGCNRKTVAYRRKILGNIPVEKKQAPPPNKLRLSSEIIN